MAGGVLEECGRRHFRNGSATTTVSTVTTTTERSFFDTGLEFAPPPYGDEMDVTCHCEEEARMNYLILISGCRVLFEFHTLLYVG